MQAPRLSYSTLFFAIILTNLVCLIGCGGNENSVENRNTANTSNDPVKNTPASDNIDELLTKIRLPEVPEEAVWKEEVLGKNDNRVPGPTDTKITAVLKYTPEQTTKLIALLESRKQTEVGVVDTENWFPEELTAQAQLSGDSTLKGTSYGANDFFNIPYGSGKITRIGTTDFFVLELIST